MIINYKSGKTNYRFVDQVKRKNSNVFTVIVGKNGTGKSRLLSSIVDYFYLSKKSKLRSVRLRKEIGIKDLSIKVDTQPTNIIAVSTSVFDKFPVRPYFYREENNSNYFYLGLRDLRTMDFGLSFMSKITRDLIGVVSRYPNRYTRISKVINYFGYTENITMSFHLRFSKRIFKELETKKEDFLINNELRHVHPINRRFFFKNEEKEIDSKKVNQLLKILRKINPDLNSNVRIRLNNNGISSEYDILSIKEHLFLLDAGILKLRDVLLKKPGVKKDFKLKNASSGEQCLFTTFLGIACRIKNGSIICIDEPEISLHPEWQQKYIELLTTTFVDFKKCHFIIATHSPQIISKLKHENCFILLLDKGTLRNAPDFINRSIDFQLANVFNSPGFKNEYLNRIAFSIMSKVAKSKKFDDEDIMNYEVIESQIKYMAEDDPIIQLFTLIKDLKKKYGRYK